MDKAERSKTGSNDGLSLISYNVLIWAKSTIWDKVMKVKWIKVETFFEGFML